MNGTNSLIEQRMAMGIDWPWMMLLGQESIRDVILFPKLKPR